MLYYVVFQQGDFSVKLHRNETNGCSFENCESSSELSEVNLLYAYSRIYQIEDGHQMLIDVVLYI